jgi:hypothetical protein
VDEDWLDYSLERGCANGLPASRKNDPSVGDEQFDYSLPASPKILSALVLVSECRNEIATN